MKKEKRMAVTINWKRLRAIPQKYIALWLLMSIALVCCIIGLVRPATSWLRRVEDVTLQIDKATICNTNSTRNSRYKLQIQSDGETYYLWYPWHSYYQYADAVETYLLSDQTKTVYAKILPDSTLWDMLSGNYKIVDLRSENAVFYELDTEVQRAHSSHNNYWILLACIGLLWLIDTPLLLLGYGVVNFRWKKG